MNRWLTKIGLLLGLGTADLIVQAQSIDLITSNFTSSVINNNIVLSHANATGTTAALYGKRSSAATKAGRTTYVPTAAARRQAIGGQQATRSTAQAQQFAAAFGPGGSSDYAVLYRQALAGTGLRDNDVADAFTAYVVAAYQVAHGATKDLLPTNSSRATRAQLAPAVGRVVADKPATTVAALGEYFKLQTALLVVGAQQSTPAFRQNVAAILQKRFHLDVMALQLTEKGFVKR